MNPSPEHQVPSPQRGLSPEAIRVIVRVILFAAIAGIGTFGFPSLLRAMLGAAAPILIIATMATFGTGVLANALLARMYEEGRLSSVGLGWSPRSLRELFAGIGGGAAGAGFILAVALALRMAFFESRLDQPGSAAVWLFSTVLLLFGAFGEELIFHGYAFQLLTRTAGDFAALLPFGVLFGVAHLGNQNVSFLGVVNTVAWGILLGYAFLRTRALWLSIGLHFGWNAAMPLIGVNLSGFTIGVTGYELHWRAGSIWSGGDYGFEGGIFTTVVVIALASAVHRLTGGNTDPA
jgi:uncharacterized protein